MPGTAVLEDGGAQCGVRGAVLGVNRPSTAACGAGGCRGAAPGMPRRESLGCNAGMRCSRRRRARRGAAACAPSRGRGGPAQNFFFAPVWGRGSLLRRGRARRRAAPPGALRFEPHGAAGRRRGWSPGCSRRGWGRGWWLAVGVSAPPVPGDGKTWEWGGLCLLQGGQPGGPGSARSPGGEALGAGLRRATVAETPASESLQRGTRVSHLPA